MDFFRDEFLEHYGMPRRSGRYPWGSGKEPYQHSGDFLARVEALKKEGLSEADIAKAIGLTTTQLRVQKSLAKDERRSLQVEQNRYVRMVRLWMRSHRLWDLITIPLSGLC